MYIMYNQYHHELKCHFRNNTHYMPLKTWIILVSWWRTMYRGKSKYLHDPDFACQAFCPFGHSSINWTRPPAYFEGILPPNVLPGLVQHSPDLSIHLGHMVENRLNTVTFTFITLYTFKVNIITLVSCPQRE